MNLSKDQILKLFRLLNQKQFHINPVYIHLLNGDVSAAYFLTQLMLWQTDYGPGFYHEDKTIHEKTGMNIGAIKRARNALRLIGFLDTELHGLPKKLHYTVDIDSVIEAIVEKGGCGLSIEVESTSTLESNQPQHRGRINLNITKENKSINKKINNNKEVEKTKAVVAVLVKKVEGEGEAVFTPEGNELIQAMGRLDITNTKAAEYLSEYGPERIGEVLAMTEDKADKNPAGYFVNALKGKWAAPKSKPKEGAPRESDESIARRNQEAVDERKRKEAALIGDRLKEANVANRAKTESRIEEMRRVNKEAVAQSRRVAQ